MQIDGKTQAFALGLLAALGFIAALSPSALPSYIPTGAGGDIIRTAGIAAGLVSAVGAAMGLFSSSKPGPLAPQDPEVVKAATALAAARTVNGAEIAKLAVTAAMQNH